MTDNVLPIPSGPGKVGSITCGITDHGRAAHLLSEQKGRVIIARVWYPADESTPASTKKEKLWRELHDDPATPGMMKLFLGRTRKITTNSLVQPEFSRKIRCPRVLIYNHGMISFAGENTFLMEDLASHGYIVISLQHAAQLAELKALQKAQSQEERKQHAQLEKRLQRSSGNERAVLAKEYYQSASNTNRIVAARTQDVKFVSDNLSEILSAIPGIDTCVPDTDIIGVMGYSVGGSVATEFSKTDDRAGCVVNMDGGIYGMHIDQPISTPYFMLYSQDNHGCNVTLLSAENADTITCRTIDDTRHMNFHEIAMIYPSLRWLRVIGKANPFNVIIKRNQYIIEFIKSNFLN